MFLERELRESALDQLGLLNVELQAQSLDLSNLKFRFGEINKGKMSVIVPWGGTLNVTFTPHEQDACFEVVTLVNGNSLLTAQQRGRGGIVLASQHSFERSVSIDWPWLEGEPGKIKINFPLWSPTQYFEVAKTTTFDWLIYSVDRTKRHRQDLYDDYQSFFTLKCSTQ